MPELLYIGILATFSRHWVNPCPSSRLGIPIAKNEAQVLVSVAGFDKFFKRLIDAFTAWQEFSVLFKRAYYKIYRITRPE